MAARPTMYPRWAEDNAGNPPPVGSKYGKQAVLIPSSGKRDLGWEEEEFPPRQYLNWISNNTYRWVKYFDEKLGGDVYGINSREISVGVPYYSDGVGALYTGHNALRANGGFYTGSQFTNNMSINAWIEDSGVWKHIYDGTAALYIQRADSSGQLMHEWWATDGVGNAGDDIVWKEIMKISSQNDIKNRQGLFVNRVYATAGGPAGLDSFAELVKDSVSIHGGDKTSINQPPLWTAKYEGDLTDGFSKSIGRYREGGTEDVLFSINKTGIREGGRKQRIGRWVDVTGIYSSTPGPSSTIYDGSTEYQSPSDFEVDFVSVMTTGSTLFLSIKITGIVTSGTISNPARFEFPLTDPNNSWNDILDFSHESIGYAVVKGSTVDTKFYELHIGNGDYYTSRHVIYSDPIDWHGGSGATDTEIRCHCVIDMRNYVELETNPIDVYPLKNKFY